MYNQKKLRSLEKAMTQKQRIFCKNYVQHWNAARAVREAGYDTHVPNVIAIDVLKSANVQAYLDEIRSHLEEISSVNAVRNIMELAKLAYGNISDLHENWEDVKDWEDLSEGAKAMISELKVTKQFLKGDDEGGYLKTLQIKTHDKVRALSELNKMMGYNEPSKIQLTGPKQIVGMIITEDESSKNTISGNQ